jgi:hypothetical protein
MEEKTLGCWEQFEEAPSKMICDARKLREQGGSCMDYPLFRGVGDSRHHLESSLERIRKAKGLSPSTSLSEYWRTTQIVRDHVETVTGKKWNLDTRVHLGRFDLPAYEFMAYLRQNGFPSPLLDWTKSPYIAAFFAFGDIYRTTVEEEHVSILAYREYCGREMVWLTTEAQIHRLWPTIAISATHYLQQSEYSICVQMGNGEPYFVNHEAVKGGEEHDILVKYNIPMSERGKVLERLDLMNITAYSLFNSEPSLMDTLAIREIVLEI